MNNREPDYIQPWRGSAVDPYARELSGNDEYPDPERRSYVTLFLRHKLLMAAVLVGVFATGMLYTLARRPVYEATAKIVVSTSNGGAPVAGDDITLMSDLRALTQSRSVETQVEMISSPDLLDEAYRTLDLRTRLQGFASFRKMPNWAARVAARKNTDVIIVTGRAYTPIAAAMLANNIARVYFKQDLIRSNQATRQARQYAGEKMIVAERQLAEANSQLARYKEKTSLYSPEAQLTKAADQMVALTMDLDAAKAEAASSARQAATLGRQLSAQQTDVVSNTTVTRNPQYDAISGRIDGLNAERITLLQEFTEDSREVRSIEERIRREEAALKNVAQTIVGTKVHGRNPVRESLVTTYAQQMASHSAATARASALASELAARQREAQSLPERERGFSELAQRVSMLKLTYETLSSKYNALLLREQGTLPAGMLVSRASQPEKPAFPRRSVNAGVFFFLGMLLAVAAAIVADRLDKRIHDESDIEQITRLPSLSVIPSVHGDPTLAEPDTRHNGALLESFRMLRNAVTIRDDDQQAKIIAVTSAGRSEGKSTVSLNLACAMAMERKRVMLVDGDLRRPSVHRLLNLPTDRGLVSVLAGAAKASDVTFSTGIDNVWCIPSGPIPGSPTEMLNSQASRDLFRALADEYDTVIIDCPPTAGLSDMQVIATIANGVLLVTAMGQTVKPQFRAAVKALLRAGAHILGVVINRADSRMSGYDYYEYAEPPAPPALPKRKSGSTPTAVGRR